MSKAGFRGKSQISNPAAARATPTGKLHPRPNGKIQGDPNTARNSTTNPPPKGSPRGATGSMKIPGAATRPTPAEGYTPMGSISAHTQSDHHSKRVPPGDRGSQGSKGAGGSRGKAGPE